MVMWIRVNEKARHSPLAQQEVLHSLETAIGTGTTIEPSEIPTLREKRAKPDEQSVRAA